MVGGFAAPRFLCILEQRSPIKRSLERNIEKKESRHGEKRETKRLTISPLLFRSSETILVNYTKKLKQQGFFIIALIINSSFVTNRLANEVRTQKN